MVKKKKRKQVAIVDVLEVKFFLGHGPENTHTYTPMHLSRLPVTQHEGTNT